MREVRPCQRASGGVQFGWTSSRPLVLTLLCVRRADTRRGAGAGGVWRGVGVGPVLVASCQSALGGCECAALGEWGGCGCVWRLREWSRSAIGVRERVLWEVVVISDSCALSAFAE